MIDNIRLYFIKTHIGCYVILLFGLLNYVSAEESSKKITETSIKTMVEKAEPIIEEVTGRTYKTRIKFKLVKRAVVRDVLAEELLPQFKKLLKGAGDDMIARQTETTAHMASQIVLGKYSYLKKELYIIPDNIKSQVERLEIKDEHFEDFIFFVVAHEMVHALDDQHFNLQEKLKTRDNVENMQAFNAFIEGHAVYVTKKIADHLKLSETARKLSVKSAAGITDENNRMQQQIFHNIYIGGSEFVETIVAKEGLIIVAKAFTSPPISTRQIMHPEEYLNTSATSSFDCAKLLRRLERHLPTEGMHSQSIPIGPLTLRAILVSQGISEKEANVVADGCLNGALIVATKRALKTSTVTVIILNFITREVVSKFVELGKKVEQSEENQFNAKLNASYNLVKEEKLKLDGYDNAIYRHVEKKLDENITTEISAEGTIGTIYVGIESKNMKKEVSEKSVSDIFKAINIEQLKLKKASEPMVYQKASDPLLDVSNIALFIPPAWSLCHGSGIFDFGNNMFCAFEVTAWIQNLRQL